MKKKLTAMVTAVAMMVTLVPSAVFATEAAPQTTNVAASNETVESNFITVVDFNNRNIDTDDIIVAVKGPNVCTGNRINATVDGVSDPVFHHQIKAGEVDSNGSFSFKVPKKDIPNLEDPTADINLVISIQNSSMSNVYYTQTFKPSRIAVAPETMQFSLVDGTGYQNRLFNVKVDANYFPAEGDKIVIESLSDSDKVLETDNFYINNYSFSKQEGSNMLVLRNGLTANLHKNTVKARVKFYTGNKEITSFTKTFDLASKYGELKELQLVFDNTEIYRGETVTGHLYFVNKQGKKYDISSEATYSYPVPNSNQICSETNPSAPEFTVKDDAPYGKELTIIAQYGNFPVTAKRLTVAEKIDVHQVKMDTTSAKAGNTTPVNFTFIGNVGFNPTKITSVRWVDSSNDNATFDYTVSGINRNGAKMWVNCDTPCNGKIEITFGGDKGEKYRVLSDTFTFTDPNATDKRTVTLTIGSKNMDINGSAKPMDVAPLIYQNRTFVPLRAVGEAFGADFDWDAKNYKITISLNGTTIVMKPGQKTYTINGVQKTMDVAPYIVAGADRTMIPVRFVSDGFKFGCEPIYRPDGTTAKVVITN